MPGSAADPPPAADPPSAEKPAQVRSWPEENRTNQPAAALTQSEGATETVERESLQGPPLGRGLPLRPCQWRSPQSLTPDRDDATFFRRAVAGCGLSHYRKNRSSTRLEGSFRSWRTAAVAPRLTPASALAVVAGAVSPTRGLHGIPDVAEPVDLAICARACSAFSVAYLENCG
jgi:hypothetical protein